MIGSNLRRMEKIGAVHSFNVLNKKNMFTRRFVVEVLFIILPYLNRLQMIEDDLHDTCHAWHDHL